jgi:hypothetical protein
MGNSQSNVQTFTVDKVTHRPGTQTKRIEIEVNTQLLQLRESTDKKRYYKGDINVKNNGGDTSIIPGTTGFIYTPGDSYMIIKDYNYSAPAGLTGFLQANVTNEPIKDIPRRRERSASVGGYKKSYKRKSQRKKNKRSRNLLKINNTKRKYTFKRNKFKKTNRKS